MLSSSEEDTGATVQSDLSSTTNTNSHVTSPSVNSSSLTSKALSSPSKSDSSFIQNRVALQRSSSASSARYDAGLQDPGILSAINFSENDDNLETESPTNTPDIILDDSHVCCLAKSSSSASRSTMKSVRSMKSVQSVVHLGTIPMGTLRVHSEEEEGADTITKIKAKPDFAPLRSGDAFLVSQMPVGSLFAYDMTSFTLQESSSAEAGAHGQGVSSFEGIKDIPPGPHFFFAGSTSPIAPRNGFWIISHQKGSTDQGDIHVRRWDKLHEILEEEVSTAEATFRKNDIHLVFDKLLPYETKPVLDTSTSTIPLDFKENMWRRMTSCIKGAMLSRITGGADSWNHWKFSSQDESDTTPKLARDGRSDLTQERENQLPDVNIRHLNFVFPKTTTYFDPEDTGRARSINAMDTTSHISAVISDRCTYEDSDEVVGEFQFCYITGMMLGNISCMEQWGHVVKVLFKAYRLPMMNPLFFKKVIQTLHAQLIYDDEIIDGSIFDHDHDLRQELKIALTTFKSRLNEQLLAEGANLSPDQEAIGKAFEALESWLWKWDWDLRGHYVRSGKLQLEDGEFVDAEMNDFEAEDERVSRKSRRRSDAGDKNRSSSKPLRVRWSRVPSRLET